MSTAHLLNLPGQLAQSEALQPNASTSIERWVLQGTFTHPKAGSHFPRVFPNSKLTLTSKQSSTKNAPSKNPETLALNQSTIQITPSKLCKKHWFHSLPFQRFQALLTLFPKSFSSFPHGTCLLSVSNLYLALDEIYHPLCAPIPRNVTLSRHTVHGGLQMTNGTLALVDALFQEAYMAPMMPKRTLSDMAETSRVGSGFAKTRVGTSGGREDSDPRFRQPRSGQPTAYL